MAEGASPSSAAMHEGIIGSPPSPSSATVAGQEETETRHHETDSGKPLVFKSEDLNAFTKNFDDQNLIGPTQFGKLYRGIITRRGVEVTAEDMGDRGVTVKIVDMNSPELGNINDLDALIYDEVKFLRHPSVSYHPSLVKVIGYCCEKELRGVVYDLSPFDTLYNLILKDEFTWVQRIKVALGFARLLEFLHGKEEPLVVFNLAPLHIMLDQEYNPVLFEFGLLHGGFMGELDFFKKRTFMAPVYVDACLLLTALTPGPYCDVFVYGMILLELIAKRTTPPKKEWNGTGIFMIDDWAKQECKVKCSLAHDSFEQEPEYHPSDSLQLTELGMRCIEYFTKDRPTMQQVVEFLERLQVVVAMQ